MTVEPLPRCCERHDDWKELTAHLVRTYDAVDPATIAQELWVARAAVEHAQLRDDALFVAELIARYRLLVRAGQLPDAARLDPQHHVRPAPADAQP